MEAWVSKRVYPYPYAGDPLARSDPYPTIYLLIHHATTYLPPKPKQIWKLSTGKCLRRLDPAHSKGACVRWGAAVLFMPAPPILDLHIYIHDTTHLTHRHHLDGLLTGLPPARHRLLRRGEPAIHISIHPHRHPCPTQIPPKPTTTSTPKSTPTSTSTPE